VAQFVSASIVTEDSEDNKKFMEKHNKVSTHKSPVTKDTVKTIGFGFSCKPMEAECRSELALSRLYLSRPTFYIPAPKTNHHQ